MTPLVLLVLFLFIGLPILVAMYLRRGGDLRSALSGRRTLKSTERALSGKASPPRWVRALIVSAIVWVAVTGLATLLHSSTLAIWLGGAVIAGGAVAVYRAIQMPYKFDDDAFDQALRDLLDKNS